MDQEPIQKAAEAAGGTNGLWRTIGDYLIAIWEGIKTVFAAIFEGVCQLFGIIVEFISSIFDG